MFAKELEDSFLKYFVSKDYKQLDEISLVPKDDDTLLFTNSGMVQFKNVFLGLSNPEFEKVVTVQTCVRLGGKHDDLKNIGLSPHHNTSFRMLGNFAFTNVNKGDVIREAIEFLVDNLKIDFSKLIVSVHKNDLESKNIWLKSIGITDQKIIIGSDDTNMWSMDRVGPCGYCTEIFYRLDNNELLELWNLVFMQYNRTKVNLVNLKNVFLDTGMGLERILSVKQNVYDNFKTDIYKPLINVLAIFLHNDASDSKDFRILVDHLKTAVLLIKENILPGNENRSYVLKKLIRRSILAKDKLNKACKLYQIPDDFFFLLNSSNITVVKEILRFEEEKLLNTIKFATKFLTKKIDGSSENITHQDLFKLYDTYGMPFDVIRNLTSKYKIEFNVNEFNLQMNKQIDLSKDAVKLIKMPFNKFLLKDLEVTGFIGYKYSMCKARILCIIYHDVSVEVGIQGQTVILVTNKTPFYAEKGGQVADGGIIISGENIINVFDVQEIDNKILHYCHIVNGSFKVSMIVSLRIDKSKRVACRRNHSATHLLHAVLKNRFGVHIKQMGSFVSDKYLRFDFFHFNPLSVDDINSIESIVNKYIHLSMKTYIDTYFDTKRNEIMRTVIIGDDTVSSELCAGTHVKNTKEIFFFKIFKEYGIGNNIRRIEAGTGYNVIDKLLIGENVLNSLVQETRCNTQNILDHFKKTLVRIKALEKEHAKNIFDLVCYQLKYNDNVIFINEKIRLSIFTKNIDYFKIVQQFVLHEDNLIILHYINRGKVDSLNIAISKDLFHLNLLDLKENLSKQFSVKGSVSNNVLRLSIDKGNFSLENITNKIVSYISVNL